MDTILTKITQGVNFKTKDKIPYINAVVLMGVFTFLFLGAEYLYVDVLSLSYQKIRLCWRRIMRWA